MGLDPVLSPAEFPRVPRAGGDPYSGDVGDPVDRHLLLAVQPLPVLDGPGKERERRESAPAAAGRAGAIPVTG